jgi:hypothetical protein
MIIGKRFGFFIYAAIAAALLPHAVGGGSKHKKCRGGMFKKSTKPPKLCNN